MVAAPHPETQPLSSSEPESSLVRALLALRVAERARAVTLSVLVYADDTFWVGRRLRLEDTFCDTTPHTPTRWDPPVGLDPRSPRRPGFVEHTELGRSHGAPPTGRIGLVVSDRTVLGVVELQDARAHAHAERAHASIARVAAHLTAAIATAPEPRARLILGPDGVCLRSGEIERHEHFELARLFALHADDPRSGSRRLGLGLATVELEPLEGPAGPHLLVTFSRPSFHVVPKELPLTHRQREIADLASHGLTVGEIAAATRRAPDTIKTHLKSVYRTLGVANRLELRELLSDR